MKSVALRIEGMHCAACVSRVEKVLVRVPGVAGAQVNYATGQANVDLTADVAPAQLIAAVERAGYGARVPQAVVLAEQDAEEAAALRQRWRRVAFAGAVAVPAVLTMIPGVVPHPWMYPVDLALLVACVPVMAWSGRDFYVGAAKGLRQLQFDMNTLIALGTLSAFGWSAVALLAPSLLPAGVEAATFIDVIPVVIAMVLLGQAIEARARRATGKALRALMDLAPAEATLLEDGEERVVPVAAVHRGDLVRVRANARVPVDGTIERGTSAVDRSMLTGEPVPVAVGPGDAVVGGTVNGGGVLDVRAEAVGDDAVLARIVQLVDRAQATRPPIAALVDRVAGVFVPVVMGISLLTLLGWAFVDPGRGLVAAVAVLVVACPCAMGLATPISLVIGLGNAARAGVLLRDGKALQALAEVDVVVFDKTGTLTVGRPVVTAVEGVTEPGGDSAVLRLAAAADRHSNHPLAQALLAAAPLDLPDATEVNVVPGLGVEAVVEGRRVRVGSPRWLGPVPVGVGTPLVIEVDGRRAAVVRVTDPLREGVPAAIAALRALGIDVVLLSGDQQAEAERIGAAAGIARIVGEVLPDGKITEIQRLRAAGRRVAMVGDGVNDAPALAAADVGIAMGSGTDVAMEAADVTLQRADPAAVVDAVNIARATLRNVKQNLLAAFGYNTLAIPIAAVGLLHPAIAGAAMAASSVTVVTNARRLARRSASG
jgi:Cu+-exporting ATPase